LKKILFKYFELIFLVAALSLPAFMHPDNKGFSFCFLKLIGVNFCPGCGLAHAISYLFHGDFAGSVKSHPLGIFAVVVICLRIIQLSKITFIQKKLNTNYGTRKQYEWY
jgi:hypothetical protein